MALKMHPSLHMHAGEWLKAEVVEARGIEVKALARHFGVSRQALSNVLNGHSALTADMAVRFEHALGISADALIRMQGAYELAKAREHEDDLAVPSLIAA